MRINRRAATVFTCGIVVALTGLPASAAPRTACVVSDPRLDELSGLVATPTGFVALNDGQPGTEVLRLYILDAGCRVVRVVTDRSFNPLDPEDLARTADGTLWVGDLGDNDRERATVAVDRVPPGAGQGTTYRLTYPDRAHDAEALVIQPDRHALVVTKELSGVAGVYVSQQPLTGPPATIPLRAAGLVTIRGTDTAGGPDVGSFGSLLVTGAALAPDAGRVVLRTYTDAYEWDVVDGDVVAALIREEPRRTALPGEPQGEAISFTADGGGYVTVSEGVNPPIRRWAPPPRPAPTSAAPSPDRASAAPSPTRASAAAAASRADELSRLVVAGVGALGLALLLAGVVRALRSRRRGRSIRM